MKSEVPFRLSAVGDISFEGSEADVPSVDCFEGVASELRQSDLVVANLECALACAGSDGIRGKCTLRGAPEWAQVLTEAGVGLVSLANNHVMDYGSDGLLSTIAALREAEVRHVGAGRNRSEAHAPVILDIAQRRVAFLARSAVLVSAPTYATDHAPGVAFLDADETVEMIRACRSQADLVVFMVHWGVEEFSFPSPEQRQLAKRFIDAGADLILGHHPHVLQGAERFGNGVVAYSLGNFVFNEFEWQYALPDGSMSLQSSPLSPENRTGIVATFEWSGAGIPALTSVFTRIGQCGKVSIDADPIREQQWMALCATINRCCYGIWWKWYAMRREWTLRLGQQISLSRIISNLHKVRFRHIIGAFVSLRRSARIVSEKSTNPYE